MENLLGEREPAGGEEAEKLVRSCMEPVISRMRRKSPEAKEQACETITEGQRALFLFMMAADHAAASPADYYCWLSYLIGEEDTWIAVKVSLAYVGADKLLALWEETERLVLAEWQRAGMRLAARPDDLDGNQALRDAVARQYAAFTSELPNVFAALAAYIRARPDEFLQAGAS